MTIGVCIGTFGDLNTWLPLAERAIRSVEHQHRRADQVEYVHGETLAGARNEAAYRCETDHLVFLDADDELDPAYLGAMETAVEGRDGPVLVQPSTLGVYPDGREDPCAVLIPAKPLLDGNYMVIGTMIRRDQFLDLGGFEEWEFYEDWDLWLRAWRHGAELLQSPGAIYRVHVNDSGRNSADRQHQIALYNRIRQHHLS